MTFDFFNKAQDQNVLPFKFRLTVDSSRVLISTTQTFSTRHAHSVGVCVNVFVCEHHSSPEGLHMQVSNSISACLKQSVCHSCFVGRRRCVKENRAALSVFKTNVNCSQNWTFFSPSRLKLFSFGFNEVLLAEASLTCERG